MYTYPIKFTPILKDKIWGGNKLKNQLYKNTTSNNVGESWEISGVEGHISVVSNGIYKGKTLKHLLSNYKSALLGKANYTVFGNEFPLLIKFLDARTNLSVQVHPDDTMAKSYHNSFGKTEMWYIMDSDENAEIILGLNDKQNGVEQLHNIHSDNVYQIFNRKKVKKGESYFIPAGKVHAIGAGVLAAEIQQTSDITYRIYDWDRTDSDGNQRELHTDLAIEASKTSTDIFKTNADFKSQQESVVFETDFFSTNRIHVEGTLIKDYTALDSFVIYMCVEGTSEITINGYTEFLKTGETILIPANTEAVKMSSKSAKLLEVYIHTKMMSDLKTAL